jgi:hypothetical protein
MTDVVARQPLRRVFARLTPEGVDELREIELVDPTGATYLDIGYPKRTLIGTDGRVELIVDRPKLRRYLVEMTGIGESQLAGLHPLDLVALEGRVIAYFEDTLQEVAAGDSPLPAGEDASPAPSPN